MWPLRTFSIVLLVSCSGLMQERFLTEKTSVPCRKNKGNEGICRQDTYTLGILPLVSAYFFNDGKLQFSSVLLSPYFKKE